MGIVNPMARRPYELFDHKTTNYDEGNAVRPSKFCVFFSLISYEIFQNPQVNHDLVGRSPCAEGSKHCVWLMVIHPAMDFLQWANENKH